MLSDDDRCPPGYRAELATAAWLKFLLVSETTSAGERLELLEQLNSLPQDAFSLEVLSAIKPAGATDAAMIEECVRIGDERGLDLLATEEVFGNLRRLNPSLLDAVKLMFPRLPALWS